MLIVLFACVQHVRWSPAVVGETTAVLWSTSLCNTTTAAADMLPSLAVDIRDVSSSTDESVDHPFVPSGAVVVVEPATLFPAPSSATRQV
jgi:hypothetical protein